MRKKDPNDLKLEFEEVPDYSGSKPRVNSKRVNFGRESREVMGQQEEGVESVVRREMEGLRSEIYQNVAEAIKEQGAKYDKALVDLVTQINSALKKKEEGFTTLRTDTSALQEEVRQLSSSFQSFAKENE